jgi:hypothetical protein
MSKKLDFNTVTRPVLQLVMLDEAKTEINVSSPTEGLVEELQTLAPELDRVLAANDPDSIKAAYDLAARLISCNRSGLTVTVDDLRGKYQFNLEMLIMFFSAYIDFISEIANAKN